jgi:hypothetical protein
VAGALRAGGWVAVELCVSRRVQGARDVTTTHRLSTLQHHGGTLSRSLLIAGAIILLLGIAGIAVPYFTTEQTKNVANVGPLHVQATEQSSHFIPPLLSGTAAAVGVVLMGVGLMRRA